MIRSAVVIALLGFVSSCQRRAEQPTPPPLPPAPAESPPPPRTPPPVSKRDAAAAGPEAAAPHPDASASDSGGQAAAALRPITTGDPVLLEHVGPESTSLEIQLPPRFTLNITELSEEQLPRATLKGPRFSLDVYMPDADSGSLSREKEDLKTLYPTLVFDRTEEISNGHFVIFHDTDGKTHKLEYYARIDHKKLGVTCSSSAIKSLQLAEQAISICLSLHDRNAQ
jgi:hypothetical protein